MDYTPLLIYYCRLNKFFPAEDIKGAVELLLIALSHTVFCFLMWKMLAVNLISVELTWNEHALLFIKSCLIGVGCIGVSGLFCKAAMQCVSTYKQQENDLKAWLSFSRGGWVKHHLQSLEIFPFYISLFILAMQVGSEEIIFRGIIFRYFILYGIFFAAAISIVFFTVMQMFLMHKWEGAIFPMIGAAIMGIVHTILYVHMPVLWPLIVAHITFFLFSVL